MEAYLSDQAFVGKGQLSGHHYALAKGRSSPRPSARTKKIPPRCSSGASFSSQR